ncbi:MAG: hypothetical protein K2M42_07355, partial [Oscillospiraceae bacterium]|nr:hypothetical protein [Oscillospiraceae bacterium]
IWLCSQGPRPSGGGKSAQARRGEGAVGEIQIVQKLYRKNELFQLQIRRECDKLNNAKRNETV